MNLNPGMQAGDLSNPALRITPSRAPSLRHSLTSALNSKKNKSQAAVGMHHSINADLTVLSIESRQMSSEKLKPAVHVGSMSRHASAS